MAKLDRPLHRPGEGSVADAHGRPVPGPVHGRSSRVLRFRITELDFVVICDTAREVGLPISTLVREAVRLYVEDFTDGDASIRSSLRRVVIRERDGPRRT